MVDLQSSNRVKLSKVRETTFGVTPTSPAFKTRRVTSHALTLDPQTAISAEIRSDRSVADVILTAYQAGGQTAGEAAFNVLDDDIEEALQGTWSVTPTRDNAGTADSVITAIATSGTLVTCLTGAAFVLGQLVLFSGFGVAGNNGVFKCTTGSATAPAFVGSGITDEAVPPANAKMKVVGFQGASGDLVISGSTMTSTSLDFTTLGLVPGQWAKLANFVTAADNDFVRISAIAAHTLTFDRMPLGWANDAGTSRVISAYFGDVLTNASTKRSNTFERQYLDHSPVTYEYLTGLVLDKLTLSLKAGAVVTYTEDWIGAGGSDGTTRVSGATDTAAPANSVINAATNIGRIALAGAAVIGPSYVMEATVEIANNTRRQMALGNLAAVGVGDGEFDVSLTLNTYFGDRSILDSIRNNTLGSFDFRMGSSDTNSPAYLFDLPSIKFTGGSPSVSGKNTDVMLSATASAIVNSTYGYSAMCERFWYVA